MVEIKSFVAFQEFLDYNKKELLGNYFVYYHLFSMMGRIEYGQGDLYGAYNVNDEQGHSIICVWVTGAYFVYSNSWTDEMLDLLVEEADIKRFKDYNFIGQRELVLQLFDKSRVSYLLVKDRLVYECASVNAASPKVGKTENATYTDLEELAQMSMENYIEEYKDGGGRTLEDKRNEIGSGIETGNLFLQKDGEEICGIVQVINHHDAYPMIGNLFTKTHARNKGYAFSLLHTVTAGLLNNGYKKCGLLSDATNPASNKVFDKIGYKPIYRWINVFKSERE